jgi:dihydropteroate synthase
MMRKPKELNLQDRQVMAIVNLTPDSFYAESRQATADGVRQRVEAVIAEGATIIDIGGYSSRPGAAEVSLDEEWRRVRMGLEALLAVDGDVVVSVDTFRSEIVRRAYEEYGPLMVNDISAGEIDGEMLSVVARYRLPYVAMHMRGMPDTMQSLTEYKSGVVRGVREYFEARIVEMTAAGIDPKNIILDPGFGFAKSVEQNMELMKGLGDIAALGYPLLVGVSRKSMIYKSLNITPNDALPGSLAMAWEALVGGAKILRVHDVAATRQIVDLFNYYNKVVG